MRGRAAQRLPDGVFRVLEGEDLARAVDDRLPLSGRDPCSSGICRGLGGPAVTSSLSASRRQVAPSVPAAPGRGNTLATSISSL